MTPILTVLLLLAMAATAYVLVRGVMAMASLTSRVPVGAAWLIDGAWR